MTYIQVDPGEKYEFTEDDELKEFWNTLDAQGVSYSTEFYQGKATVEIA